MKCFKGVNLHSLVLISIMNCNYCCLQACINHSIDRVFEGVRSDSYQITLNFAIVV